MRVALGRFRTWDARGRRREDDHVWVMYALLVPTRALGEDQGGRFLLVVSPDNVVQQRYVQLGDTVSVVTPDGSDHVAIDDGDVTIIGLTYGQSLAGSPFAPPAGAAAVPEPGSVGVIMAAGALATMIRRRR